MILWIIILLIVLSVDAYSAYWLAKRLFAKVEDSSKGSIYKWVSFAVFFLVFGALSLFVFYSEFMFQR